MRHKYATSGLVLARTPIAEAGLLLMLLTPELGLIRARAEGVRRPGAKLAHALQSLREADLMLVRGKEGWRVTGAVLAHDHFLELTHAARMRAARVAGLLLRLVSGETDDPLLHERFLAFIDALSTVPEEKADAAETLAALRILAALGVDAGEAPPDGYGTDALTYAEEHRGDLIARINRGIVASGL